MTDNAKSGLFGRVRGNAEWDFIKAVIGGLLTPFATALHDYIKGRPLDWWGLLILGVATALGFWFLLRSSHPQAVPAQASQDAAAATPPSSPSACYVPPDGLEAHTALLHAGMRLNEWFDPLQVEALQLSWDIRKYLRNFEPKPEGYGNNDSERVRLEKMTARVEWSKRLMSGYTLRFGAKEKEIELKFGEVGVSTFPALPGVMHVEEKILLWSIELVAMAFKVDGISLKPEGFQ